MTWYIKLHLDWRGLISMNNQRYDFSEGKGLGNCALLECYKCFFMHCVEY